jgi:hypothetical protein
MLKNDVPVEPLKTGLSDWMFLASTILLNFPARAE